RFLESGLFCVDRMIDMGARVVLCDPHRAVVAGPSQLHGATMVSPDIRAGMALLAAALCARGSSVIRNAGQIDRGYERIDERLRALGARITRDWPSAAKAGPSRPRYEVPATFSQPSPVISWAS